MPSLTSITITPSGTITKGTKAAVVPTIVNTDRISKVTGVDDTGASVTDTYTVHTNVSLTVVPASQALAPGVKAPAGTIVLWTDSPTDVLTVDAANPLTLDLQT